VNIRFAKASAAVALLAVLISAQTALAGTIAGATWGWVTARRATTPSYSPAAKDQGNSAAQPNQVQNTDTGDYNVIFPDINNMSPTAGIPIITALSTSPRFCSILDWGINNSTLDANTMLRCFGYDGEAASSQFSTIYVRGGTDSVTSAYLYAGEPTSTDQTPESGYNFNTSGGTNTVHRNGLGQYTAHLPYMAFGGNIQVTAGGDATCKIAGRQDGTNELLVDVNCFEPNGDAKDTGFALLYISGVGPKTVPTGKAAYLFANRPSTSAYTPSADFSYSSAGMTMSVHRSATGKYMVTLNGMAKGGGAFVTAVGTDKARCQLTSIRTDGTPQKVGVACFKPNRTAVDSKFMLAYTR
jgi:hypothetical protein